MKLTGLKGSPRGLILQLEIPVRRLLGWWNLHADLNLQSPVFIKYGHSGWPGLSGYTMSPCCCIALVLLMEIAHKGCCIFLDEGKDGLDGT